jgi:hypothetical protein
VKLKSAAAGWMAKFQSENRAMKFGWPGSIRIGDDQPPWQRLFGLRQPQFELDAGRLLEIEVQVGGAVDRYDIDDAPHVTPLRNALSGAEARKSAGAKSTPRRPTTSFSIASIAPPGTGILAYLFCAAE